MIKITPPSGTANSSHHLHPRNRHQGHYDFARLTPLDAELAMLVRTNTHQKTPQQLQQKIHQKTTIDFTNPVAVKALNRALLKDYYGIQEWDIPAHNLCPPIPGRADYLHYLADLLASGNAGKIPKGSAVQVLDIGVGASCIYPLIGNKEYGWHFVGTDINSESITNAQTILEANPAMKPAIQLRLQTSANAIFKGVVSNDDWFDLSLCNPPFHSSVKEASAGTQRKWENLGKEAASTPTINSVNIANSPASTTSPLLNFGGHDAELWCPGGELVFIQRMIKESAQIPTRCFWFSSLVSKSANLPGIYAALKQAGVHDSKTIAMVQGQKQSRFVAWTFLNTSQQTAWRKLRWSKA